MARRGAYPPRGIAQGRPGPADRSPIRGLHAQGARFSSAVSADRRSSPRRNRRRRKQTGIRTKSLAPPVSGAVARVRQPGSAGAPLNTGSKREPDYQGKGRQQQALI